MRRLRTILVTVAAVLGLLVLAAVVVAYAGWINVAATHPHLPGVEWFLQTAQVNGVDTYATRARQQGGLPLPDLSDAAVQQRGLATFASTCVMCHGAPGVERSPIGQGLNPRPPELSASAMSPIEKAWVIKHGIRMTGMPAFGPTHSDEQIGAVVAFVEELPGMSPTTYQRRLADAGLGGGHRGAPAHHEDENAPAAPAATVDMTGDLRFVPQTVRIKVGERVRWRNTSSVMHTVTADPERAMDPANVHLPEGAEPFHSGTIAPGEEYSRQFTVAGRYQYFCVPHERAGMVGTVIVESGDAP